MTTGLRSWGNHPPFAQVGRALHWRGGLAATLHEARAAHGSTLAYGCGRSYGDSCLAASGQVLQTRSLDRFIAADWSTGVLRAEAGVTLRDILALAIPRGWFLPVTPGTQHVTLGGAIANDVHGKNHHRRGCLGSHVQALSLVRSDGTVECTPNGGGAGLFAATVGGLGLTGLIEWAELRLVPIASTRVESVSQRFGGLDEFFALSDELDARHEFAVSWLDCAGPRAGRGIYTAGDFAAEGPLEKPSAPKPGVPFTPPLSLVGDATVRAFNRLYWARGPRARTHARVGHEPFFYPLDGVPHWNRLYGPRGFQQYQCVLPESRARDGVKALVDAIARARTGSFLAVLKRCGDVPSPGLLSFPMPGVSLALDFPQSDTLDRELPRLDAIVREAGGRLYPAKDAHMTGEDFRRAYPAWQQVEALRDPALLSRFWQRVTA